VAVPDAIEPVVGWRCWRVRDGADGFELVSTSRPTVWPARSPVQAGCDRGDPHLPPATGCTCGIYAAAGPALPVECLPPHVRATRRIITPAILGYDVVLAVGLVALWGEIVVCEWGWRGRYAYPRLLFVQHAVKHHRRGPDGVESFDSARLAAGLEQRYGVPTRAARSLRPATLLELAAA
jgi:hypothetical protein